MTAAWSAGPRPLTSPMMAPGTGVQLIVELQLLLWTGGCGARPTVGVLALWHGHPARQCRPSSIVCIGPPPLQPPSAPFIKIRPTSVRPCLLRTVETGWRGGRRRTYRPISRSQSRTSMKNACPWKLYMPPGMCGDVMYVCMPFDTSDGPQ